MLRWIISAICALVAGNALLFLAVAAFFRFFLHDPHAGDGMDFLVITLVVATILTVLINPWTAGQLGLKRKLSRLRQSAGGILAWQPLWWVGAVLAVLALVNPFTLNLALHALKVKSPLDRLLPHRDVAVAAAGRPMFRPPPHNISYARAQATSDEASLGSPDAPVTILLYLDFSLADQRNFVRNMLPRLKSEYADTNRVFFVLRVPYNPTIAKLDHCLAQSKKLEFLEEIARRPSDYLIPDHDTPDMMLENDKALAGLAQQEGLTEDQAAACMADAAQQTWLDSLHEQLAGYGSGGGQIAMMASGLIATTAPNWSETRAAVEKLVAYQAKVAGLPQTVAPGARLDMSAPGLLNSLTGDGSEAKSYRALREAVLRSGGSAKVEEP